MKACLPPNWRYSVSMSGVFGHKLGRKNSRTSVWARSVKYSVISGLVFRQVKYV